ncbi:amidase [Arthrobacter sp. MYb227]|uniref:amidase n=1 Tax=Arthrobacter sp. MYb227 TaxID=1848601 RepID=UPI000CFDB8FA|nr:amidase [Arthrobacter sp. MYb227]PQZ90218.1 amidase [Arthrobacter sp. MYb227]
MSEISGLSALELRDALSSGNLSAHEVTSHFLNKIEALNPVLGSFITVTAESALESAVDADKKFAAAQTPLPALHGMPLAFKDLLDVAGVPTTYGTAALPAMIAATDNPLVSTIRRAGAISLGKTQVPEFGLSCHSENDVAPAARNPLNPALSAGGSSGGEAAAIAAGMLPFGPGNDGGGSVRIPASACGLIGLKPGLGTVPSDVLDGTVDSFGAPRLTVSGPLAHNALDAALLMDAMVDPTRSTYLETLRSGGIDSLRGLRIGVSTASPFESAYSIVLAPESHSALSNAIKLLNDRSHHLEEAEFFYDLQYPEAFSTVWTSGLASAPLPAGSETKLGTLARSFRERATTRAAQVSLEAAAKLTEIAADFRTQWGRYDVVLTPAMAHTPPEIGFYTSQDADIDYMRQCQYTPFTSMVNVSGLPAITVPTLRTKDGLSMGVQIIGRAGSEIQLLALAAQLTGV